MSRLQPVSVLDVGVGCGKYGVLAREFLEDEPCLDRKIRIDGIEVFPRYINAGQRFYYDEIFIDNALDRVPALGQYDLILIIDVLEHLTQKEGLELLKQCVLKGKHILVSTPLDIGEQGAVFGNEFERHRFQWKRKHFAGLPRVTFFWNYHSLLCLIGPDGRKVRREMNFTAWKIKFRSQLPGLYILYRKNIRKLFFRT